MHAQNHFLSVQSGYFLSSPVIGFESSKNSCFWYLIVVGVVVDISIAVGGGVRDGSSSSLYLSRWTIMTLICEELSKASLRRFLMFIVSESFLDFEKDLFRLRFLLTLIFLLLWNILVGALMTFFSQIYHNSYHCVRCCTKKNIVYLNILPHSLKRKDQRSRHEVWNCSVLGSRIRSVQLVGIAQHLSREMEWEQ